ncbi:MAG: MBL fold metallo-hydrolase [Anaerovoracaceae bacterium]|jgi:phosphoribosyl 1,2-cyclic phosphodiesterase
MGFEFCSFASGSSGNCYLARTDRANILVDCGIAGKNVLARLREVGLSPEDLSAILITHEHIDHVKSIRMISKKAVNAGVYATEGTLGEIRDRVADEQTVRIESGQPFSIGDIEVEPFALSHDAAEPVGFSFVSGGKKLSVVTDTGVVTGGILEHMEGSDTILLEANHEVNILRMGPYSYSLKRRILSDHGHLSNDACAETLGTLLESRSRKPGSRPLNVVLGHLSKINNTPDQAYITVKNELFEKGYYVGDSLTLAVAKRDEAGRMLMV